jgi:hypothetical protein
LPYWIVGGREQQEAGRIEQPAGEEKVRDAGRRRPRRRPADPALGFRRPPGEPVEVHGSVGLHHEREHARKPGVASSAMRWASRKRGAGSGDWRGGGSAGPTGDEVVSSLSHEDAGDLLR